MSLNNNEMFDSENTFHTTVNGLPIYSKETIIGIANGRAILKSKENTPDIILNGTSFKWIEEEQPPLHAKSHTPDAAMINFKGGEYTFTRFDEIVYEPFYAYIFYRIKKVDHVYSYFVKDSKFIPLKRNKSWTRFIFPWLLIGKSHYILNGKLEFKEFSCESLDSLSEFFATLLKLED